MPHLPTPTHPHTQYEITTGPPAKHDVIVVPSSPSQTVILVKRNIIKYILFQNIL